MIPIFSLSSCIEEEQNLILEKKIKVIAEKYGYEITSINKTGKPNVDALNLKFSETELFFEYLKKSKEGSKEIEFQNLSDFFSRNNISTSYSNNLKSISQQIRAIETNQNNRILCFTNAHLVSARIPAMPFPGMSDGLNGVEIILGISNGNLNTSSFNMYGFSPFLGVRGGNLNPDLIPSASNGYTYGFQGKFTVAYTLWIDGNQFLAYEKFDVKIRIDGCTGEVAWYYQIP
jgi:hypothetical protein